MQRENFTLIHIFSSRFPDDDDDDYDEDPKNEMEDYDFYTAVGKQEVINLMS